MTYRKVVKSDVFKFQIANIWESMKLQILYLSAPNRTNVPSGAKLDEFEMCLHGVTSLLEVEEMNAIYQKLQNRILLTKNNHWCQEKSFGKYLNLIHFMINIIDYRRRKDGIKALQDIVDRPIRGGPWVGKTWLSEDDDLSFLDSTGNIINNKRSVSTQVGPSWAE